MKVPGFAVVGMGGFARAHIEYVRRLEGTGLGRHVAQVAIPEDRKRYAEEVKRLERVGIGVYSSLEEMLQKAGDRIDVTCIPTGIHLHHPMTVAALKARTHVLVEKPAAGSIQDVDDMIRARDESGRLCAVGYQHLCRPDVQRIKDQVCQGRLGTIKRVKGYACWPRDREYYNRNEWAGCLRVGDHWILDSPHNNALAHTVNDLCYLGCRRQGASLNPTLIQAELYRANPIASADTVAFRAQTEEGVEVFFTASHCTERETDPLIVVEGEQAQVEWTHGSWTTVVRTGSSEQRSQAEEEEPRVAEDLAMVLLGKKDSLFCPIDITRAQSLCACGTFESSEIHDLSGDLLHEDPGKVTVDGMTEAVMQAFEKAALFSELDIPWAKPGKTISLEGYRYFPTFRRELTPVDDGCKQTR